MRKPVALAVLLLTVTACDPSSQAARRSPAPEASDSGTAIPIRPPRSCHATSLDPETTKPDPKCTPGATNPDVTPANIHSTICRSGYTRTIRPPVRYTNALKREQIREYGYTDTNSRHYEEDHFLPLSLGGAPRDPRNLWPEPGTSPNPKDQVEFKLYRAVCDGQVSLPQAQRAILTDWTTAVDIIR